MTTENEEPKSKIVEIIVCMLLVILGALIAYGVMEGKINSLKSELAEAKTFESSYQDVCTNRNETVEALEKMYKKVISNLKEKYLRAEMIKPSPEWIDRHGDSMDSWQAYQTALLVAEAKKTVTVK